MKNVFIVLLPTLLLVGIANLIGTITLRAAAKWILKIEVSFGKAFVTAIPLSIVNFILTAVLLALLTGARSQEQINGLPLLLLSLVVFLAQSKFVGSRILIPFSRACVVLLAMSAMALLIVLIVAVPCMLIMRWGM